MRSIYKFLKQLLFLLVLAIGLYLLAALVLSLIKTRPQPINCTEQMEVYVSSNGVHLDVIVPVESLEHEFAQQLQLPRGTKFVAFGWGDKNFYIKTPEWKDLTVQTAFTAVFLKSATAMHVTVYKQTSPAWRTLKICPLQIQQLVNYITNSFARDANGRIELLDVKGYASNDSFYNARGSFSLFKTCNVWVNQALKEALIETSVWSPFDFGVLHFIPETRVPAVY
ncbi:TIGR02117 family protein [Prolixibacteraceae bacterium Z1-6]|uniref:TIGR02117 family protein n=1 Tax=Draconibacterium aestuarii TaxID=2998507 RepID=A0A9X3J4R8_9BACT|nr:TIGR02117 family protein [Prolixibacteraceae bacterium Z1-6]